jgi:hypothetical protein
VPYRGYFTLDGVEIANTARTIAHMGVEIPTMDIGIFSAEADCSLTPVSGSPLLGIPSGSMVPITGGSLLYTPPDGARLYSQGLAEVGDCWDDSNLCLSCRDAVFYDDSWDGLKDFLGDTIYRPELAPWYSSQVPESAEFGGVWMTDVKGLDAATVQLDITELAGDGGVPGIPRNTSRKITFDALLIACTSAGLQYGLEWLTCQLKAVNEQTGYGVLRYLSAHPGHSGVDPTTLMREAYGVVMTIAPTIQASVNAGRVQNQQATMFKVEWELTITTPNIYLPSVPITVDWDTTTLQPIQWVHATDCDSQRAGCDTDPRLFADGCTPTAITETFSPPPTCGGCMPVCSVSEYIFEVPSFTYPMRCRDAAVSLNITNIGDDTLNLQAYFRRCNTSDDCLTIETAPLQVTALPSTAELVLDGPSGRFWVNYFGRTRRPVGIVGTPTGAPWQPAQIDRSLCWEFVVIAPASAAFNVTMRLADREA